MESILKPVSSVIAPVKQCLTSTQTLEQTLTGGVGGVRPNSLPYGTAWPQHPPPHPPHTRGRFLHAINVVIFAAPFSCMCSLISLLGVSPPSPPSYATYLTMTLTHNKDTNKLGVKYSWSLFYMKSTIFGLQKTPRHGAIALSSLDLTFGFDIIEFVQHSAKSTIFFIRYLE